MDYTLSMTGTQYATLKKHLLDPDGMEGAAVALCGRHIHEGRHRLLVQRLQLVPHHLARRTPVNVSWDTDLIVDLLNEADARSLTVVKFHSHPGGYAEFSQLDDETDQTLLPRISDWVSDSVPHASVVLLPTDRMFGRVLANGDFQPLERIAVVGDDILVSFADDGNRNAPAPPEFTNRHVKAFGSRTAALLRKLRIAVIGCSGTGSIVIEQLMRLGVGSLVIVDPDVVKDVNLNRILNSTSDDALHLRNKAKVLESAIARTGLGTTVQALPYNLDDPRSVAAVSGCDALLGCVDSHEGRFLMNHISTFHCLPYIDVGVALEADNAGEIHQVCGYVHYIQPDLSSVLTRSLVDTGQVAAEALKRKNPEEYANQRKIGYIANVEEERPAVISVNCTLAGLAVTELLARLHPFRHDPNRNFAKIGIALSYMGMHPEPEPGVACKYFSKNVGLGDIEPPLGLPHLSGTPTA